MKRKRFSVEQIVAVLKQAELGLPLADLIRQTGISEQTFYRWKKQYAGWLGIDPGPRAETALRGKCAVGEVGRGSEPGQGCFTRRPFKKVPRPALLKQVVAYVTANRGYGERRACSLTRLNRSTVRKPSIRDPGPNSACACARLFKREFDTAVVGFMCCCGERVGLSARTWSTGPIATKALLCEVNVLVAARWSSTRRSASSRSSRTKVSVHPAPFTRGA